MTSKETTKAACIDGREFLFWLIRMTPIRYCVVQAGYRPGCPEIAGFDRQSAERTAIQKVEYGSSCCLGGKVGRDSCGSDSARAEWVPSRFREHAPVGRLCRGNPARTHCEPGRLPYYTTPAPSSSSDDHCKTMIGRRQSRQSRVSAVRSFSGTCSIETAADNEINGPIAS